MSEDGTHIDAEPDDPGIWREIVGEFIMSGHATVRVEVPAMPTDVVERGLAEAARDSEWSLVVYRDDEGVHLSRSADTQMRMRAFDDFIEDHPRQDDLPQ